MYPPQTPTPLVCSGTAGEPFFFPTHVRGVGHMLGIGSTGSGKSTLAALLACAIQSIPDSRLTWLDLGHSSFVITHLLGAEYHDVGHPESVPLCPLALLDRPTGLQYLMGWFERLFFRRKGFELDEAGSKDLRNAVMDVRMRKTPSAFNPQCRNLRDLYAALPSGDGQRGRMRAIVDELIESYGYIFGGEPAGATTNPITVYELTNLDTAPKYISTPAKELILYNTIANLNGKPGWVLWDEFWDAIGDEVSAAWFFRAIRTMRRLNCGFVGFTQSSVEITKSPDCNLLLGNMPGKLFFPDDSAATPYVAESLYKLGLNPQEVRRIAGAQIGEFFYKSSLGSRLASCWLGPIGQAICASTSYQDVEAMQQLLKECASENLLDAWLARQGIAVKVAA
jgi:type IV secretion system protein VirB4